MLASVSRRLISRNVLSSSTPSSLVRYMSSDLPYHIVAGMPALSPTMEVGTLASWSVKEGDGFGAGDVLAKIETDKASIDFEAQDDGYVAKLLIPDGSEDIPVGKPIMVTVEDEDDIAAFKDFTLPDEEEVAAPAASEESPPPPAAPTPPPPTPEPVVAKPPPPPPPIAAEPVVAAEPAAPTVAAAAAVRTLGPAWGSTAKVTSPIAKTLSDAQKEYIELYGTTGQLPL